MSNLEGVIFVSNARCSFPNIADPQVQKLPDGSTKTSWNCELLLEPNSKSFRDFWERFTQMATDEWKANAPQIMQMIQSDRKQRCYGNGEEKINKKTFQPYDGYAGMMYLTVGNNKGMPQIIDANGQAVDKANTLACQQIARGIYGGCRVNAAIKPWLQQNSHGYGVRCDLISIQFAGDDKPFGAGAVDASGLFGATASPAGAPTPPAMSGMPAAPTFPQPGAAPAASAAPTPPALPPFLQNG